MKRDKMNIVLVFVFLIGLSVMLYPIVSNYWNTRTQSRAVASYNDSVQAMTQTDYEKLFQQAEDYNAKLKGLSSPFTQYDLVDGYEDILNVSGTGIMGYITIDKIGVELPIYHGTSDGVLQIAAGHLEGSGLPIGGLGNHSVLSAHRGLPSAKLFTNLDELEWDDTFQITILNRTMTYQVDQIRIVEPQEVEELKTFENRDYVTLVTCTPYGINTHRLLVRGIRIADEATEQYIPADGHMVNTSLVAFVIAIVILLILLIIMLILQRISWWKEDRKRVN